MPISKKKQVNDVLAVLDNEGLTETEVEQVRSALYRTYQTIGSDIVACNNGREPSKAAWAEAVIDYVYMYGGLPKDLLQRYKKLPYTEMLKIAKKAL
jgi:hypothetical protein